MREFMLGHFRLAHSPVRNGDFLVAVAQRLNDRSAAARKEPQKRYPCCQAKLNSSHTHESDATNRKLSDSRRKCRPPTRPALWPSVRIRHGKPQRLFAQVSWFAAPANSNRIPKAATKATNNGSRHATPQAMASGSNDWSQPITAPTGKRLNETRMQPITRRHGRRDQQILAPHSGQLATFLTSPQHLAVRTRSIQRSL